MLQRLRYGQPLYPVMGKERRRVELEELRLLHRELDVLAVQPVVETILHLKPSQLHKHSYYEFFQCHPRLRFEKRVLEEREARLWAVHVLQNTLI